MAAHHCVVLHHYLFGDDLQIQQVAVKHLLAVAVVDVELLVALRIADQGDLVPLLDDGVAVRARQNAVAADPLHVTTGVGVDAGFAQGATADPGGEFRADAIGAG